MSDLAKRLRELRTAIGVGGKIADYLTLSELDTILAALEDAERAKAFTWLESNLFLRRWNGVVGPGSKTMWELVGHWRHVVQGLEGPTLLHAIRALMKGGRPWMT